jgi:putative glutamine amidotransferase
MGQDGDFNTIDKPYAYTLTLAGLNIVAVGYVHCEEQMNMNGCHALLLPGGSFTSPSQYYVEGDPAGSEQKTSFRAEAYRRCFHMATAMSIPVLGICAGMQIIAAELGCRMTSNLEDFLGDKVEHKTTEHEAHEIDIIPGTLLHELVKAKKLTVNSRHTEGIVETNNLVVINALAPDGCPEALEVAEDGANIFGVQWHPEDYVMKGDKKHFAIYRWLAQKARETQAFNRAAEETVTEFT